MSVPSWERGESYHGYRYYAIELYQDIVDLLLRDFGVKDKQYSIDYFSKDNLSDDQKQQLQQLMNKCGCTKIPVQFPKWLLDHYRENILNTAHDMCQQLTLADSITDQGVSNLKQFYQRQTAQNKAIADCKQLQQEFQDAKYTLPVQLKKFTPYIDLIESVLQKLENWRKTTNTEIKNLS